MDYDELLEKYKNGELTFTEYSNDDDLVEEEYNKDHDFINALFEKNGLDTNRFAQDYQTANNRYVENAKLAMQKAIQLHHSSDVPDYAKFFVLNDYVNFDRYLYSETIEDALSEDSSYDYANARRIFKSESPEKDPEFLGTLYDGIENMLSLDGGYFFVDRGNEYAIASDTSLVEHADELVNVYELAKHADELINKVQSAQLSRDQEISEKQKAQQEEIIERLNMVKSQKRFLEDDLMRLECLGNKYASHFDLSSMDTVKYLSDTYEKINSKESNFEVGSTDNDKDFIKLCESCHQRWTHAAEAELEAAETLLTECDGAKDIMMLITEDGEEKEVPFEHERAKAAFLKSKPGEKFQLFFNKQDNIGTEKIALDLCNDGKQAWAKYKVQIDCDCNSLDVNKLPKDPGWGKRLWNKVIKFFGKEGIPEVEEYNKAKSKLKEITDKIKEHVAKKKKESKETESLVNDESGKEDYVEKDLVTEAELAKANWEKVGKGEYAKFMNEWEAMSKADRDANRQKAIEWANLKKKWDEAPESEKQKSKITTLRSSKVLQQRKLKNEIKRAEQRAVIKENMHHKLSSYMTELFKGTKVYERFGQAIMNMDDIYMLTGKGFENAEVDYKKASVSDLTGTIERLEQSVQHFKDEDGNLKPESIEALTSLVFSDTRDMKYSYDVRSYYNGNSELEKFDDLHTEDKTKLPDATKLAEKRQLDFTKAVISEVEKKIKEFKDYLPEAEKREFKQTLKNRFDVWKDLSDYWRKNYDFSKYDKVIDDCTKKYPDLKNTKEYKVYTSENPKIVEAFEKNQKQPQADNTKTMNM